MDRILNVHDVSRGDCADWFTWKEPVRPRPRDRILLLIATDFGMLAFLDHRTGPTLAYWAEFSSRNVPQESP
jgi:hypothetical protein